MQRRPSWLAWLATAAALLVIWIQVRAILEPDATDDDPPIRIGVRDGDARPDESTDENLQRRLVALAADYVGGVLTLDELRDRLGDVRGETNLVLVDRATRERIRWLNWLRRALEIGSLAALLLLAGPLWMRREGVPSWWRSWPSFVLAAAALLTVFNGVVTMVIGLQELQIAIASYGSPSASAADAALHYAIHGDDPEIDHVLRLIFSARDRALDDPWGTAGLVGVVWNAVARELDAPVLRAGLVLLSGLHHLLALYGPMLAAVTLVVAARVLAPTVRGVARYPIDVARSVETPTLGRFVVSQIGFLWRELRAAAWMLLAIVLFTALAMIAVRLLTGAATVILIKTLLAALATGALPEAALLATMASLLVFVATISLVFFAAAAIVIGKLYPIARARIHERRTWRSFPAYWKLVRGVLARALLALLVAGGVLALYWIVETATAAPGVRVWLAAPLLGPVTVGVMWRLHVPRRLWQFARTPTRPDPVVSAS
jgi:hypothetical protein